MTERRHIYGRNSALSFFRQAGGCLEIREEGSPEGQNCDDLVHVCEDDVPQFMIELAEFIDRTPPLH